MQFQIHESDSRSIIEFKGRIRGVATSADRERIAELVQPDREIVLDFSGVESVSNQAIRSLLFFFRYVHMQGGLIRARRIPRELLDSAEAAGFVQLFQQAPDSPVMPIAEVPVSRIDVYPTHHHSGYGLRIGDPWPLGVSKKGRGVNFAVFSHHATACTLVLFENGNPTPICEIPFPQEFRIGDVFTMIVFDLDLEELGYGFRVDGPYEPEHGHRFDATKVLIDPMAPSLAGREIWADERRDEEATRIRSRLVPDDFDWEGDQPLRIPIEELVVYEMHVRGFTRSPTSNCRFPGTFAGMREKIEYLVELGINCVELMPIFEFDELENPRHNPLTGERLYNFWGYDTVGFFAPKAGYAASGKQGMQVDEFKYLVKELHRAGIEVILDVVFNHTSEGNEHGKTLSFRGLDNRIYYMLTPDGKYYNFSGCGNTLNCNHPVVRDFVLNCLRYWVAEFHIDGFRFDLASILGRDTKGAPLKNPPLLESLAMDPVLQGTKLIAEAWDAGGLYQVGSFPKYDRWAEWNGKYRDCVRKFLKGDEDQVPELAQRLLGSPDLYPSLGHTASVNFITCHDGFTLADLVSYNSKHNEANGEENRDGTNDNNSWNCGTEGETDDASINALRQRQMKNAFAILFLSRGTPMVLMGDECGRSQRGNNNTYCHDGDINWFNWDLVEVNAELMRFFKRMLQFRISRLSGEHTNLNVVWHGTKAFEPDWSRNSRSIAVEQQRLGDERLEVIYVAFNMFWQPLTFELPPTLNGLKWHSVANTSADAPDDFFDLDEWPPLGRQDSLLVESRSIVILIAK